MTSPAPAKPNQNEDTKTALLVRAGTGVWAPHPSEAWITGFVEEGSTPEACRVQCSDGTHVVLPVKELELNIASAVQAAKIEDLTKLPNLHEPGLLHTLHERFKLGEIYTYTGPILLAVNPFKRLVSLYADANLKRYMNAGVGDDLPPHAWRLADRAFQSMAQDFGKNQSILVSGESGAGKTETTKIVMRYLTAISHSDSSTTGSMIISDRVLQLNPLMEAFGNAKTSRNDNSSRFGKLIQMKFHPVSGKLSGAHVDTYLLEKARVVHQSKGERSYHCFYELAAGATQAQRQHWALTSLKDFRYTNQSDTYTRADITDEAQFKDTLKAMDVVGLTEMERASVFDTVVAILHLGNVDFEVCPAPAAWGGKVGEEGSTVVMSGSSGAALGNCARLLGVDADLLKKALTTRRVNVGLGANTFVSGLTDALGLSETFTRFFNPQQASEARDALAMALYDKLFLWIVWRVNESISQASKQAEIQQHQDREGTTGKPRRASLINATIPTSMGGGVPVGQSHSRRPSLLSSNAITPGGRPRLGSNMMAPQMSPTNRPSATPTLTEQEKLDPVDRSYLFDYTVGCLDIFGFEVFERNSFEQLCINFANETLQQQFNEFVFELEQQVYKGEGIDWAFIHFPDNKPTLDMIEARPIGLLSLIDEECLYPAGDDKSLANKLYQNLPKKYSTFTANQKDKVNRQFVVHHFAGKVVYNVDGMYAKNKNELHQELVDVIKSSNRPEVKSLMAAHGDTGNDSSLSANTTELKRLDAKHARGAAGRVQQKTVGALFKGQLALAMAHIRASQPHYVRCLKPNDRNVPDLLMRVRTVEQLRYSGVLEVVKVARAGYPTRFRLVDFCRRYYVLLAYQLQPGSRRRSDPLPPCGPRLLTSSVADLKAMADNITRNCGLIFGDDYQIGKTKVFLRPATFTRLEICKGERLHTHVVAIQRVARGFLVRNRVVFRKRAAVKIQAFYRGYKARCTVYEWRRKRRAAKVIQRRVRGVLVRAKYDPIFNRRADAAHIIHRAFRRRIMQLRLRAIRSKSMQERAAVMLQSLARVLKAQKVANSLYVAKVTDMAATSIQGLAAIIKAKKQRKILEKKRLDEKLPEGAQFVCIHGVGWRSGTRCPTPSRKE